MSDKMNPEIKEQWVAALRSGEYEQNHEGLLRTEQDTFCCLGVLCDLAVKAGVIPEPELRENGRHARYTYIDDAESAAPRPVLFWSGLSNGLGYLGDDFSAPTTRGSTRALAYANDDGVKFHEIADIIEEYL